MAIKKRSYNCPAEMTLSLIGGKWKAILVYNLRKGPKRFGELRRLCPGVTAATLTQQLREMVENGLVDRRVLAKTPLPAVEYALSDRGESLKPILYSLVKWGIAHQKDYAVGEFGMAVFQK